MSASEYKPAHDQEYVYIKKGTHLCHGYVAYTVKDKEFWYYSINKRTSDCKSGSGYVLNRDLKCFPYTGDNVLSDFYPNTIEDYNSSYIQASAKAIRDSNKNGDDLTAESRRFVRKHKDDKPIVYEKACENIRSPTEIMLRRAESTKNQADNVDGMYDGMRVFLFANTFSNGSMDVADQATDSVVGHGSHTNSKKSKSKKTSNKSRKSRRNTRSKSHKKKKSRK